MNDMIIKNTKEAIVYGQSMNEEMAEEMKRGQKMYHAQSVVATKAAVAGDSSKWNEASEMGYKAQLCREAVEAFNGTLKLRNQS